MKRAKFQTAGMILAIIMALSPLAFVDAQEALAPEIHVSKFHITSDGQYVEVYNRSATPVDMTRVQLVYYNNYDIKKATSSKLISLSGELAPNGYYLVNDSALTLCYQTTVASASLGLSATAGMVQLIYMSQAEIGGPFVSTVLDTAAWSKAAVAEPTNVQKLPTTKTNSFLERQGEATDYQWAERWPSASDPCQLESSAGLEQEPDDGFAYIAGTLPPVRYVAPVSTSNGPVNRNVGKAAPIVNEALPNPASPQTDAEDEFIELYNPNEVTFDLTGFKLAFGSTNPKKYTFPEGTVMRPKEFKAFTSGDTSISLSNDKAQVWLLDPNEKIIGQSDPYEKAKDGQAWVLDRGKWVWSLQPTPGAMNTVALPTASSANGKNASAALGISSAGSTSSGIPSSGSSNAGNLEDVAPLHGGVLAGVGTLAVAYGLYEYRHDLSNQLYRTRRYLRNRQALRVKA